MFVPRSQIIKELVTFCDKFKTRKLAAKSLKVTQSALSLTINSKNNVIPERILKRLGYRMELSYVRIAAKAATKEVKMVTAVEPEGFLPAERDDSTAIHFDVRARN